MILRNHFINDSRVLKEGTSLVRNGFHVTIFCLWDKDLLKTENNNGIYVKRIKKCPYLKATFYQKIKTAILFAIKVIFSSRNFDIIHCHDLETLPTGVLIKWFSLGRKKVVYDAHEYETERTFLPANNLPIIYQKILRIFLKVIERFFIIFADHVICVSNGIANEYVKLYGIKKPSLIFNCPPYLKETPKKNYFRKKFNLDSNQMIFLYQGNLNKNRGIEVILEVFKKRRDHSKVIIFMGNGLFKDIIDDTACKYKNIFFLPAVPSNVLLDYTSSADIGIFLYKNNCLNHYYCLPNKFFEYTQAELPVVISDLYEMKLIIKKYGNGVSIKSEICDLEKIIDKITWEDIKYYRKNIPEMKKIYNWEQQEKVLLQIYESLS